MGKRQPRTNRGRALRLLVGGAVGGAIAWLSALVGFGITEGPAVLGVVGLSGFTTMLFFGAGQLVQVIFADADPIVLMMATMLSYVVRVGGLAAFALVMANANLQFSASALAISIIAVVAGWIAAEIWVFTQLRIPSFDPPQAKMD